MITPGEIKEKAERLYLPFLRTWLQVAPFFPQAVPVGKLPADYLELRAGVDRLLKSTKTERGYGYTVELRTQQTQRYGAQSLPTRITLDTERDLLKLIGKEAEFRAFQADVALIRAQLPQLDAWLLQQPQRVIEQHGVWPELLQVCLYFQTQPQPQVYLRELPIAVHTKFIETHSGILRRLLDVVLPLTAINAAATTFEQRFGLRYDEPLIRVRLLDEQLRARYSLPFSDMSTPISQFATLNLRGQRCVITENKLTFLTLPQLPDTFAIFGGGFSVDILKTIPWLADCLIVYWGDLDAQGFQILSLLRASLPQVVSTMMDAATFAMFSAFAVPGTPCSVTELPHLTATEHAMFVKLAQAQLRLEQERISHAFATSQLQAITAASTVIEAC